MAKTDNLIDYLTDIADAIREKKGTSDLINAQNFADEIKNMPQSGGGSAGGGEEKIRYCKVLSIFGVEILGYTAAIVKCNVDGTVKFYPTGAPALDNLDIDILAAGIIISDSYEGFNATGTKFEEMYAGLVNEGLLQTITEEEFYNLNA